MSELSPEVAAGGAVPSGERTLELLREEGGNKGRLVRPASLIQVAHRHEELKEMFL